MQQEAMRTLSVYTLLIILYNFTSYLEASDLSKVRPVVRPGYIGFRDSAVLPKMIQVFNENFFEQSLSEGTLEETQIAFCKNKEPYSISGMHLASVNIISIFNGGSFRQGTGTIIAKSSKEAIQGLLGDSRPAATIRLAPGLNQIIHHTVPFDIVFSEGDSRWADYVALDGLADQLAAHPALPQVTPVSERYVRSVKSLIVGGSGGVQDRLTGRLPYELVLEGSLKPGAQVFRLYAGDRHQSGILIKAFRHSDRAVVDQAITDSEGRVTLRLPTADRYLISGVVIGPDADPAFDWLSYWPALTLAISE